MLTILAFLTSFANADWGPFPLDEEEYNEVILEKDHPPCNFYSLTNGQKLPKQNNLYTIRRPTRVWGTPRMIETIIKSTEDVAWLAPDADPLSIGDISKKGGGHLPPHKSHRGGSDVDIGIFWGNGKQSVGFKTVTPKTFDHETNWIFVRSLLATGHVERILLDQSLVNELRRYVIKQGEMTPEEANRVFPAKLTSSVWMRHGVVHHTKGHANHYHVRTFCESKVN